MMIVLLKLHVPTIYSYLVMEVTSSIGAGFSIQLHGRAASRNSKRSQGIGVIDCSLRRKPGTVGEGLIAVAGLFIVSPSET
jgi:hypothetical protein